MTLSTLVFEGRTRNLGVKVKPHEFRVNASNIAGLGAVQLVSSLLPVLEQTPGYRMGEIYLPSHGDLALYQPTTEGARSVRYKRRLPNAISRALECTLLGDRFDGKSPLLVLGDIPIRCNTRQTVFVQTTNMTRVDVSGKWREENKYAISRAIFRANLSRVAAIIVQTRGMKTALANLYPGVEHRVFIIPQPPPDWLLRTNLRRHGREGALDTPLRLFYPASGYLHKNHGLLRSIQASRATDWPVAALTLTLPADANPAPDIPWINCVGHLGPDDVLSHYRQDDALLFLSRMESYGFPLVEAMWVGLPIICPDLPYARDICGSEGIYFDPDDIDSLHAAAKTLQARLGSGWWPDWTKQRAAIPSGWSEVAASILGIVCP